MASLRSYFSLCGLVGGGPLGVEPDEGASPAALVTLSRNVVMRYRLSDQKQVGGWNSKEFITAPVVYDSSEKCYAGVFAENKIKVWKETDENLDRVKKIKFQRPIHRLISGADGRVSVVFRDGGCASLEYATAAGKNLEKRPLLNDETVVEAAAYRILEQDRICLLTQRENKSYCILTCELNLEIGTPVPETAKRFDIERSDPSKSEPIGMTICNQGDPQVYVLWSDGRLFSYDLRQSSFRQIGRVPWLGFETGVSMARIGEDHLALYGADAAQDGAVLVVFNTVFGVGVCRYPLKMHRPGARLWRLPDNLLLEANRQLAVVPYALSSHRDALSLLGSDARRTEGADGVTSVDWGKGAVKWKRDDWEGKAGSGAPERDISRQYLSSLLDRDGESALRDAIEQFADVSETLIVSLLNHVMKKCKLKMKENDHDTHTEMFKSNTDLCSLLDAVLQLPFVSFNIISHLRVNFDADLMVILLKYINYCLAGSDKKYESTFERVLLKWGSVLIDSNFQNIVIVKNDESLEAISALKDTLDGLIEGVKCIESVLPQLHSICYGEKDDESSPINDCSLYYIEEVKLF